MDVELRELTNLELINISGGNDHSIWYYVGAAIGGASKLIVDGIMACGIEEPGANGYTGCKI